MNPSRLFFPTLVLAAMVLGTTPAHSQQPARRTSSPAAPRAQTQQPQSRQQPAIAVARPDSASATTIRGYAMLVHAPIVGTSSLDSARERLARALAANDRRVLRATPQQYLQALQRTASEAELRDTTQLADYIRSLTVVQCPQDLAYPMSRVLAHSGSTSGRMDLSGQWSRRFAPGEPCLYDNNLARNILSLACGNVILPRSTSGPSSAQAAEALRAVAAAPSAVQREAPRAAVPAPQPVPQATPAPAPQTQPAPSTPPAVETSPRIVLAQRPTDTVLVREAPPQQAVVFPPTTLIRPLAPPPSREPTVIVIRERRSWAAPVLVTTALAAATYFIVRANRN